MDIKIQQQLNDIDEKKSNDRFIEKSAKLRIRGLEIFKVSYSRSSKIQMAGTFPQQLPTFLFLIMTHFTQGFKGTTKDEVTRKKEKDDIYLF